MLDLQVKSCLTTEAIWQAAPARKGSPAPFSPGAGFCPFPRQSFSFHTEYMAKRVNSTTQPNTVHISVRYFFARKMLAQFVSHCTPPKRMATQADQARGSCCTERPKSQARLIFLVLFHLLMKQVRQLNWQ